MIINHIKEQGNRVMKWINKGLLMMLLALLLLLGACAGQDDTSNDDESTNNQSDQAATNNDNEEDSDSGDEFGGALRIALDAQPPSLDPPTSPATSIRDTARLVFETLVTTDKDFKAVPMLAESVDISDDSRVYTFKLREGVKFHNGKEMTAEDVIASMERWQELSTITGTIFDGATWTAEDDYTVVLELVQSSALTLDTLASAKMMAAIMPKEVIESASATGVEEYIGTGPYEFVEWKQDQYIHFKRFDDYQPVESEASGLAGKKVAYFDDIYFYVVPDASTRLIGLQTGEYDFAYGLPTDNYEQVRDNPDLNTILTPSSNVFIHFNKKFGPTTDFKFRQAVNTAIDVDELMLAGYSHEDLYWVDSGYMDINMKNWASTAGSEYFNLNDPDQAKQILSESSYNGEEVVIMLTRDYPQYYNIGVVLQEQLVNIGINSRIDVYDWPTFNDKTHNEQNHDQWDIFVVGASTVSTPPQLIGLSPGFAAGVQDQKAVDMMKELETAPSLEEAQKLWDELQQYAWEELLPIINLGGSNALYGVSKDVEGITTFTGPVFWNAKFVNQ